MIWVDGSAPGFGVNRQRRLRGKSDFFTLVVLPAGAGASSLALRRRGPRTRTARWKVQSAFLATPRSCLQQFGVQSVHVKAQLCEIKVASNPLSSGDPQ